MKRIGLAVVVVFLAFAPGTARAVSLTVSTNQPTYTVGQTVTVTVFGDTNGGTDNAINGTLQYSAALTDTVSSSQSLLISTAVPWIPGILSMSDGSTEVFDQSRGGILPPAFADQLTSTLTLTAMAPGTVNLSWAPGLDFFGLTSASGTSFTITPEPGTASLLTLGLAGIVWVGRRRRD